MRQGCRHIQVGDTSIIICGGEPTDHKCNENAIIYGFSDGFNGTLFEKAKAEKLNLNMCDQDKIYFLKKKTYTLQAVALLVLFVGEQQ